MLLDDCTPQPGHSAHMKNMFSDRIIINHRKVQNFQVGNPYSVYNFKRFHLLCLTSYIQLHSQAGIAHRQAITVHLSLIYNEMSN